MSVVAQVSIRFQLICCYKCGVPFQVPEDLYDQKLMRDRKLFWCPNGDVQRFISETEAKRLQRELDKEKLRSRTLRSERDFERNSARALKGHLTRTRKRVGSGVCPCCSRTFQQLARHMKARHPAYTEVTGGS